MNKKETEELAWVAAAILADQPYCSPLEVEFDFTTTQGKLGLFVEHLKVKYPAFREEFNEWWRYYKGFD